MFKRMFLFLAAVCLTAMTFAHEYYFAFAEMQYNKEKQRLEISIRATGHDVESYMEKTGNAVPRLEDCINDPQALQKLEVLIQKHFVIQKNDKTILLELIGMEVNNKDEVIFYVVSRKMDAPSELHITFDLLMSFFEEQQNKLTIFSDGGKAYLSFLPHQKTRTFAF